MYSLARPCASVEITGPSSQLDYLLASGCFQDARRCDLHVAVWLELRRVSIEQTRMTSETQCKIHITKIINPFCEPHPVSTKHAA